MKRHRNRPKPKTKKKRKKAMNPNQHQGQIHINVNPDDLPKLQCGECQHEHFVQAIRIAHLSAVVSPTGKQGTLALPGEVRCAACGALVAPSLAEIPAPESGRGTIEIVDPVSKN